MIRLTKAQGKTLASLLRNGSHVLVGIGRIRGQSGYLRFKFLLPFPKVEVSITITPDGKIMDWDLFDPAINKRK